MRAEEINVPLCVKSNQNRAEAGYGHLKLFRSHLDAAMIGLRVELQ